jgi:ubiquinone/menaquinone biosynthesis C-methylase UbiE
MTGIRKSWVQWWGNTKADPNAVHEKSAEIFVASTETLWGYKEHDILLDIGCGPGLVAGLLCDRVKEIHCVDIPGKALEKCRRRLSSKQNVFVHPLDEKNYTDFSFLHGRHFSKIFCVSIVQYYDTIRDVEALIREVQRLALPGAQLLIADIPTVGNTCREIWEFFKTAYGGGYLREAFKYFFNPKALSYYMTCRKLGLLTFSPEQLQAMVEKSGLNGEVLDKQLTGNPLRIHLRIKF